MKLLRAEFDRRFGRIPKRVVFLSDGGKWLRSVKPNEFRLFCIIGHGDSCRLTVDAA